jgi:hypothetical protein
MSQLLVGGWFTDNKDMVAQAGSWQQYELHGGECLTLIKKKIKFSSHTRKFRMEQLQSHIWPPNIYLHICAFPHTLGSPSSYMTLQLLHFLIYEENFILFFISVEKAY